MLNFRNTIITFAVVLLLVLAADYLVPVSKWVYAGIIIALFLLLAWGSKNIHSGFYLHSICAGDRSRKEVAFTFDDGPDAQVTPMILDMLKEYKIKAAFFIIGSKAEMHPEMIKRMDKEGHLIASHSYTHHFFFDLFSFAGMKNEMIKTDNTVYHIIGKRPLLFRPPYGVTNPPLARAIKSMQYQSIGWSLKSEDTVIRDESALFRHLSSKVRSGDIILFHDNKPWTVSALGSFIRYLKEKDYQITRLDHFLKMQAYEY